MFKNEDHLIIFAVVCMALAGFLLGFSFGRKPNQDLKQACEANLPRNQQCVMQYVPASITDYTPRTQQPLT